MRTVAIVGSHPATRQEFDFDRTDCDIWVFNEALATDWCKRADGVFQLHKPVIWRSATNRNDPNHYIWLQSQTDSTIFMIDQYEDVPKSQRYPIDKIMTAFPEAERYFTSSVAYAIALAIYLQYDKIEIYGVEMETTTEYGHQRVGVAYWTGFAAGKGIVVESHNNIFKAPLYGYDGDVQIPIEYYRERITKLEPHIKGTQDAFNLVKEKANDLLNEFVKTYKADLSELDTFIMAMGKNAQNFGMVDAAKQVNAHYLEKCEKMIEETGTYLIVRQEFEGQGIGAMKKARESQAQIANSAYLLEQKVKLLNTQENKAVREKLVRDVKGALQDYVNAVTDMGRALGIMNENKMLLSEFDAYLRASGVTPEEINPILNQKIEVEA